MKSTTKLALVAGGGLILLGGIAFAMNKPAAASTSGGGGGTPPPGTPAVPGTISVAANANYSLRIFNTSMSQTALTNALNGLGFTNFTLSQNSDGTWDLGGTWTGSSGTIQAQQNGFAFDPTF